MESVDHLLFQRHFSYDIWQRCYSWLGEERVLPAECKAHFFQHVGNILGANEKAVSGHL